MQFILKPEICARVSRVMYVFNFRHFDYIPYCPILSSSVFPENRAVTYRKAHRSTDFETLKL